jgi:type IV secretory pathway TrbL component
MRRALARLLLVALVPAATGCTALVVGGAVVGAGAAVVGTAAKAGVAVGKGVVTVATAPFGSDKDK